MTTKIREWCRRHFTVVPVDLTALMRAAAALLVGVALTIAMVGFYGAKQSADSRADGVQRALDAKTAVDTCRAQVASAVTDATTTYLFALGHRAGAQDGLVIALAVHGSITDALADLDKARQRLDEAGLVLDAARDARVAFEAKPTGGCTGERPSVVTSPSPPTTAMPGLPSTSSTVKVELHRKPTTTTTRAPLPRSEDTHPPTTTAPRTTTSTAPTPLCDLIPAPTVTVPPVTACL